MEITQLDIEGMTCASCVAHVEKGIKKLDGIDMAAVNLATEKATVSFDPKKTSIDDILKSVVTSGYGARQAKPGEEGEAKKEKAAMERRLKTHTLISAALSAPLFLAMFAALFSIDALMFLHNPIIQLALATPVQFWIGLRFYKSAFLSLKAGSPGMDVLIVLGTSAAYFFSIFNGFLAGPMGIDSSGLYFEASAIIITLVLLGRYFEARAKRKTSDALSKLMDLQPKKAVVERDGESVTLPVSDVVPGDVILIRPGDRIPVDGIVLSGNTAVDESTVTGESIPVEKAPGDTIIGGTINTYGAIRFTAEKVGKDSMLARIISVVEEAQGSKAPVQKTADKVAAVFVPAVLGIAAVTFILWWIIAGSVTDALMASVAVLVIACPCALGLATPTAIMVGTGVGAIRGILIKNGEVLQTAGKISAVVLDKTGTVTRGRPELQTVVSLSDLSEDEALELAAALEYGSEHPLALAVIQAAEQRGIQPRSDVDITAVPGRGVIARMDGSDLFLGTESLMESSGVDITKAIEEKASLEEKGNTVIILSRGNEVLALLAIADSVKENSAEGVKLLRNLGLEVYMITGDNPRSARAIAGKAGIDRVLAEVLPEGKADEVKKLQARGHVVAMAGDGINDAPALATADVGIAMGEGTDIAMESGDITLMRGDLRDIAVAILLSRKTFGKIKQNLFWAFFYNAIGIPFAALGLLNPIVAGAAMAFSSVSVVTNSLSLKKFKPNIGSIDQEVNMDTVLKIEGMTCGHCKMRVESAVAALDEVDKAVVDLDRGELSVSFLDNRDHLDQVRAAVTEAGYTVL